jgi:hypothetical protein
LEGVHALALGDVLPASDAMAAIAFAIVEAFDYVRSDGPKIDLIFGCEDWEPMSAAEADSESAMLVAADNWERKDRFDGSAVNLFDVGRLEFIDRAVDRGLSEKTLPDDTGILDIRCCQSFCVLQQFPRKGVIPPYLAIAALKHAHQNPVQNNKKLF